MTVVEGVPCGGVLRRRLIGGAKHEPRQLFTVVLLKNAPIAWAGKEECAPGILAEVGLVMERRELIVDCHAPDAGADIMRGIVNAA